MDAKLTDYDRRVVREVGEEVVDTTVPNLPVRLAVPAAFLGLFLLVGWPRIVDDIPGGGFVSPFVVLAGVILVLGGPAVALLSRGGAGRAAEAAVEVALRRLEAPESDRETLVRAATLLVLHAYARQGPATVHVFDPEEVEPRIGSRMPMVLAVERHLVEEGEAYPVFTEAAGEG